MNPSRRDGNETSTDVAIAAADNRFKSIGSLQMNKSTQEQKFITIYLILCSIIISSGSFQYGYNIGSLNTQTKIFKEFIKQEIFLFKQFTDGKKQFEDAEKMINGNKTILDNAFHMYENKKSDYFDCMIVGNVTCTEAMDIEGAEALANINKMFKSNFSSMDNFFENKTQELNNAFIQLDHYRPLLADGEIKINQANDLFWSSTNSLFVFGGLIGAMTSKSIIIHLTRKKAILLNHSITIVASIMAFVSYIVTSPITLIISRFLYGLQGGQATILVPKYLSHIAPNLFQIEFIPQIFIAIGLLLAQILSLEQVLGNVKYWNYLVAFPFAPAILSSIALSIFLTDNSNDLLVKNENEIELIAQRANLIEASNNESIDVKIKTFEEPSNTVKAQPYSLTFVHKEKSLSFIELFKSRELRLPLITCVVLQMTQQLIGINSVYFYSSSIFLSANVQESFVQYAILATGVFNFIATIFSVVLIEKFGHKKLLLISLFFLVIDLTMLITFLKIKSTNDIFSYLCIACIIMFVFIFAIGLSSIPILYTTQVFKKHQRAQTPATSIVVLFNWLSGLLVTSTFPALLQSILKENLFVLFLAVALSAFIFIYFKVEETMADEKSKEPRDKGFLNNL